MTLSGLCFRLQGNFGFLELATFDILGRWILCCGRGSCLLTCSSTFSFYPVTSYSPVVTVNLPSDIAKYPLGGKNHPWLRVTNVVCRNFGTEFGTEYCLSKFCVVWKGEILLETWEIFHKFLKPALIYLFMICRSRGRLPYLSWLTLVLWSIG